MSNYQLSSTQNHDDYINIVCHELKTPLTLLTAIIQLLNKKADVVEDTSISRSLAKAEEQVKKMGNLVNSFLNASFLENGKITLDKTDFKLNHLIGEVVQEVRGLLKNQFIILDCNEPVVVFADRNKIACVLSNLLCNAIKYSPSGSKIYIKCFSTVNKVTVRVRDEGIGIKPEDLDKLFQRFFRVNNEGFKHIEGFGIGLYLSSAIIKQHEGNIWAESRYGEGSTFYFNLPIN
jgi:two-component system, OmpR family, sensor histidine kinase VicK